MSIIKRVTHPASLSFVNLILALGSVPTVALFSSTRKSRIMIPVGICSCQCTIIPERVFNLGGITDQFVRNKWSTSPVSVVFQNGIFTSRTRAVAMRSLGRNPAPPSFIVVIISLYCSVVRAVVFLFIASSKRKERSYFGKGKVHKMRSF